MNTEVIGKAAGKIWKQLGSKGETSLRTLAKSIGTDSTTAQLAVGWLAREGKVQVGKKGAQIFVCLTEQEAQEFSRWKK